ncbi:MAG: membrane protein insertase YidC [Actinobacteria bacterium]|nr:membrane protein insertase YidC [Actinomycetota bacterium]
MAVAWVLVAFHTLLSPIFGAASGWSWALSIVGLVIVIRIMLIPLFVKQIKAQRNMQLIQPRIKELQKKYAGDREKQSAEMMKIYRETGTNPLASCLPIILQAPIFFALFRVLQYGIAAEEGIGVLTPELATQAHDASIFGVPIYATFANADETPFPTNTMILCVVLIITMSATTFLTQRQLIVKNTAKDNPMVKQQKILMYVFPVIFAVGGFNFPIGVLIYWTTTNLWSMGQQFYVIRNNPQPGTPAAKAHEQRQKEKAQRKAIKNGEIPALVPGGDDATSVDKGAATQNRQQPKRQPKSKRQPKPGTGSTGTKPSTGGTQSGSKPKKQQSKSNKSGNQGKGGKKPS